MISPRAAMALASSTVKISAWMSSSSSGFRRCSGSGGRSAETRKKISSSSQKPGVGNSPRSRSIRPGTRPISSSHSRSAAASAVSPGSRLPAGSSHRSRRMLARVLTNEDHVPAVLHRQEDDRWWMAHDLDFMFGSVRKPHALDLHGKLAALVDDRHRMILRSARLLIVIEC